MTNRSQTQHFNCQNTEFRFFDGACAVTSIVDTIPQGHPAEGGCSCELLNWPRTLTEYYPTFLSTSNIHFEGGSKYKAELVLETQLKDVRLITLSMAFLFLVLVWLAILQLHLIPTGKPSSGTDFRALGPGFKRGGTGGWFPSGAQASFSIRLIRGSLALLHTMTLPCSQAQTCNQKKKKNTPS